MTKEEIISHIEDTLSINGFLRSDAEAFFTAMSEILDLLADETEKAEPYAVNTINAYRETASNVGDYEGAISGLGGEDEDEM
jgi:hypothetical protein